MWYADRNFRASGPLFSRAIGRRLLIMDSDTRRQNLRLLAAQWGGPTGLAKKLGLSGPSYLSQLTRGTRPITEKTVRKLEKQLGLPAGWLDGVHEQKEQPAAIDEQLMRRVVLMVGAVLEGLGVNPGAAKFADLVELVYEDAVSKKTVDEDFIRRLSKLTQGK